MVVQPADVDKEPQQDHLNAGCRRPDEGEPAVLRCERTARKVAKEAPDYRSIPQDRQPCSRDRC